MQLIAYVYTAKKVIITTAAPNLQVESFNQKKVDINANFVYIKRIF